MTIIMVFVMDINNPSPFLVPMAWSVSQPVSSLSEIQCSWCSTNLEQRHLRTKQREDNLISSVEKKCN